MGGRGSGVPPRRRRSRADLLMTRAGLALVAAVVSWTTFEGRIRAVGVVAGLAISVLFAVMAVRANAAAGPEPDDSP